jgi:hypothetical protein
MMMNRKELVGSDIVLILRYYPGIRLEGLRKTMKISITIIGLRERESNPGTPEYTELLTTRLYNRLYPPNTGISKMELRSLGIIIL